MAYSFQALSFFASESCMQPDFLVMEATSGLKRSKIYELDQRRKAKYLVGHSTKTFCRWEVWLDMLESHSWGYSISLTSHRRVVTTCARSLASVLLRWRWRCTNVISINFFVYCHESDHKCFPNTRYAGAARMCLARALCNDKMPSGHSRR